MTSVPLLFEEVLGGVLRLLHEVRVVIDGSVSRVINRRLSGKAMAYYQV